METCIGCGAVAEALPWVVVVKVGAGWEARPICSECHRDPVHRTSAVKGHFFQRHQAQHAVAVAGSSTIGG